MLAIYHPPIPWQKNWKQWMVKKAWSHFEVNKPAKIFSTDQFQGQDFLFWKEKHEK
jgi:hypothetical protein